MMHLYLASFSLLPLAMIGILLPAAAGARRGMAFGVSLPLHVADSAEVRAALDRFRLRCWMSTGAVGAVLAGLLLLTRFDLQGLLAPAGVVLALALIATFWSEERSEVCELAVPTPVVRTAELSPRGSGVLPLLAGSSALLPLALTALWLRSHWAELPQAWPSHYDANGLADGWAQRTSSGVYGPLVLGAGMVLVTQAAVLLVGLAPGPERSRRQGMVLPMTVLVWVVSLEFCALGLLPVLGRLALEGSLWGSSAVSLVLVGLVLWGLRRSGVLAIGSRTQALPAYDGTPDAGWKGGGLIYFNRADAAILVPKRIGMGWTLNFARPLSWIYLGGLVVFLGLATEFATH